MKLIFAVVHDDDTNKAVRHLNEKRYRVTKLSSTGGFLRKGNTTLMIGVEDNRWRKSLRSFKKSVRRENRWR